MTTTPIALDECRKAFEKWAIKENRFTIPYGKHLFFEFDYIIWQASRADLLDAIEKEIVIELEILPSYALSNDGLRNARELAIAAIAAMSTDKDRKDWEKVLYTLHMSLGIALFEEKQLGVDNDTSVSNKIRQTIGIAKEHLK